MTIEQIVLDELEKYSVIKNQIMVIMKYVSCKKFDNLAKSIAKKIKAVSIDGDEILKILWEFSEAVENYELKPAVEDTDKLGIEYADKILSLIEPVKTLNNKEISTIIVNLINDIANIDYGICNCITGRPEKDYIISRTNIINKAINKICNLAIKKGDKK